MKVSYHWLQDYIDFDYTPQQLAKQLTMAGLEVEGIKDQGANLEDIIVGKILELEDHQNADKLSVCKVDLGSKVEQIVCGADNMAVGDKAPVAPVGSVLPGGMEIEEVELRGVKSRGMLCSADELDLQEEQADGLMILDDDLEVGQQLIKELGLDDYILELDLTPNYADCLSMIGVAREVAAITGNQLKLPQPDLEASGQSITNLTSVQVEDEELCPRYTARVIKDVEVKESPLWLRQRLEAAGIRPINNIVDITNYVLMEYGQPLHAFDYNQLEENRLVVRRAKVDEEITTLDDEQRELDEDMLVIADAQKPVCVAGVMGGANSEVTTETTDVLLEAAYFDPVSIRQTAKKLAVHSESSHRFERGVDINGTEKASKRAVELILELAGGELAEGVIDNYPEPVEPIELEVSVARVNNLLGIELTAQEMANLLTTLEFDVQKQGEQLAITVPTFRGDISREADILEEVARLFGYNQVEASLPTGSILQGKKTASQQIESKTLDILTGLGLTEVQNFSFISETAFDRINLPQDSDLRSTVKLNNPLSSEHEIMRTTLIPSILDVLNHNLNQSIEDVEIFELSKGFFATDNRLPEEKKLLAGAIMREASTEEWNLDAGNFFRAKGKLERYFAELNISDYDFVAAECPTFHPGRTAEIRVAGAKLGILGELHPDVIEEYDLLDRTVLFELDFSLLLNQVSDQLSFEELPKYPASTRDIALVVDQDVSARKIEEIIEEVGGELLEKLELFDLYQGEQLEEGTKSLAYSLVYRAQDRTLTDEEINQVQEEIKSVLNYEVGAEIRK
ncbi:MAG: phenylalanine--tRNA ligase subunit beta [Bacillota bacterium]